MKRHFWTLLALVTVAVCALAGERTAREKPAADYQFNKRLAALESRVLDLEKRLQTAEANARSLRPEPSFRYWSEREVNGTRVFVVPCSDISAAR